MPSIVLADPRDQVAAAIVTKLPPKISWLRYNPNAQLSWGALARYATTQKPRMVRSKTGSHTKAE
jgi:hypothetical protein